MTDSLMTISPSEADPDELMSNQDIAEYARKSVSTVKKKIVTQPGFPKPIRKLGDVSIHPLYYRAEVMAFFRAHQET